MLSERTKQSCPGAGLEVVVIQISPREAVVGTMANVADFSHNVADFNHNVVHMGFSSKEALAAVVANLYPPIIRIYHNIATVHIQVQHQWCLDLHKIKMSRVTVVANVVT